MLERCHEIFGFLFPPSRLLLCEIHFDSVLTRRNQTPIMDRQTFLSQLLNIRNIVQAAEGKDCVICREPYGTTSSDIGPVEKQIRLPCDAKHTVGSDCITMWLQEHNTCPICRRELFPIPEAENNTEDDDEVDEDSWSEAEPVVGVGLPQMKHLCDVLCNNLGFDAAPNHPIRDIAIQVAQRIWYTDIIQAEPSYVENFHLAAACVYMASFLVCRRIGTVDMEVVLRRLPKMREYREGEVQA